MRPVDRLSLLLAAALLEWSQDLPHERALEVVESERGSHGRIPWIFRATALGLIAWAKGRHDEGTPLILVEVPPDLRSRRRELSAVSS